MVEVVKHVAGEAHVLERYLLPIETKVSKVPFVKDAENDEAFGTKRVGEASGVTCKKQKVRGQNKHRPQLIREPKKNKLCRALWCVNVGEENASFRCPFKDRCDFTHDISTFLESKPKDLGKECHNFRTFGMCQYGLTCRYGGDHIERDGNKVNTDLWSEFQKAPPVTNSLDRDIQLELRKHQYDFTQAIKASRDIQSALSKVRAVEQKKQALQVKEMSKENSSTNSNDNIQYTNVRSVDHLDIDTCKVNCIAEPKEGLENSETLDLNSRVVHTLGLEPKSSLKDVLEPKSPLNVLEPDSVLKEVLESQSSLNNILEPESSLKNGVLFEKSLNDKVNNLGILADENNVKATVREKKNIDWKDKLYLAPLTTLGNLPFRRVCKKLGADITCSEMAVATCLLQGSNSEWALVKRHYSEDLFGVQLCGSNAEVMIKCAQLLDDQIQMDFVDINMGCPIDLIYKQGGGSALMRRHGCLEHMVLGMKQVLSVPLTLKMRTAVYTDSRVAHQLIPRAKLWDVAMVTLHGRSREQRYVKMADWSYIEECAGLADPMPLFGNGDVLTYEDYNLHKQNSKVAGIMIARGALIKPWIFTEIKEQRTWDISSTERFALLKEYVNYGLEHWGSDSEGVEKTRRFLLEWLSFLHRYIPVGILEQPQTINQRPPKYHGRDDLETLMASPCVTEWVKLSEMLLCPVPEGFQFLPKHKNNAWG